MDIFFESRHDELVSSLVDEERCFSNNMELACFAATVGWKNGIVTLNKRGKSAPESVFENNHRDGLVYAIGLIKSKDANCFRDDNVKECWAHFQNAVTCGMLIMEQWFFEHSSRSKREVILLKMLEKINETFTSSQLSDDDEAKNVIF